MVAESFESISKVAPIIHSARVLAVNGKSKSETVDKNVRFTLKAMTTADFRRIALSMPEAVEGSHLEAPTFEWAIKSSRRSRSRKKVTASCR
jgi:hypothetical protein